jgi:hypothetical protein
MRRSVHEATAARVLHGWLRRTALAAIPMVGLSGCGNDCTHTPVTLSPFLAADAGWTAASVHGSAECQSRCGEGDGICYTYSWERCVVSADAASLTCTGTLDRCGQQPCGRLPAGLRSRAEACNPTIGIHLAAAAHLEGAAVIAFQALERELLAHRAPPDLVARARAAQQDEKRHHASMSRLARAYGVLVPVVEAERVPVRTLREVALENAVEGCVRETFGAAVAAYQGEWACDSRVRKVMRSIAADEAEHASLGWAVDGWVRAKLSRGAREEVEEAGEDARARLWMEAGRPVARALEESLGLPGPAAAAVLTAALDDRLLQPRRG